MDRGRIYTKGAPESGLTFGQLALTALRSPGGQFIGKGSYSRPSKPFDPETGQGWETVWQYAAQAAEVEVCRETGAIKVNKVVAAHDVGKVINPRLCQVQIEGAIVMGLGSTVYEQMQLKKGCVLNPNFTDYKLPTTMDIPEIRSILVEELHDEGPYGAKGIGEPATAPTAAAIGNAVYDAIGIRIKDLPLNTERVLKAFKSTDMRP